MNILPIRYLSCFTILFISIHIITYAIHQPLYSQPTQELQQMCQPLTPTSCISHSWQTTQMERLERTMPLDTFWMFSENQMCTKKWPLSKYKPQSPHTSGCSTKLSPLKRLWHCEEGEHNKYEMISHRKNKGEAQAVLGPNLKMLEQWLNMGLMKHEELPTWKQTQEEREPMSQCLPGQEMKIQRLMYLPQARNSLANSSGTRQSTSRSWSITCSVQGDYQSFQTLSGSKYCRGRWLTSMLSSQESTLLSLTTGWQRHSETLNSASDIQNLPKPSGTMGIGLLHTACSSTLCCSSTPTESQSSFDMVSTLPLLCICQCRRAKLHPQSWQSNLPLVWICQQCVTWPVQEI